LTTNRAGNLLVSLSSVMNEVRLIHAKAICPVDTTTAVHGSTDCWTLLTFLGITVVDERHLSISFQTVELFGISALLSAIKSMGRDGRAILSIPTLVAVSLELYKASGELGGFCPQSLLPTSADHIESPKILYDIHHAQTQSITADHSQFGR
jgi:hypothetical protein